MCQSKIYYLDVHSPNILTLAAAEQTDEEGNDDHPTNHCQGDYQDLEVHYTKSDRVMQIVPEDRKLVFFSVFLYFTKKKEHFEQKTLPYLLFNFLSTLRFEISHRLQREDSSTPKSLKQGGSKYHSFPLLLQ